MSYNTFKYTFFPEVFYFYCAINVLLPSQFIELVLTYFK